MYELIRPFDEDEGGRKTKDAGLASSLNVVSVGQRRMIKILETIKSIKDTDYDDALGTVNFGRGFNE